MVELDPRQVPFLVERARASYREVQVVDDLSDRPRALVARRPIR